MGHVLAKAMRIFATANQARTQAPRSPAPEGALVEAYLERRRNVGAECGRAGDVTAVKREARDHRAVVARVLRLRHEKRHMRRGADLAEDGADAAVHLAYAGCADDTVMVPPSTDAE